MIEALMFKQDPLPLPPFPEDALVLKIIPNSLSSTISFTGLRLNGTVTFDRPGTSTFTMTATSAVKAITVPAGARYICLQLTVNPVNVGESYIQPVFGDTRIIEVSRWSLTNTAIRPRFVGCFELMKVPDIEPKWTSWYDLLRSCRKFNQNISNWKTDHVTNMNQLFYDCLIFNQPLTSWDVSSVTNSGYMFTGAVSFNQNLSHFNMPLNTNCTSMFSGATNFNSPIGAILSNQVTAIDSIFRDCINFNQDVSHLNTSNVTNMWNSFNGCKAFNKSISSWNVSKVNILRDAFNGCSVYNQDLSSLTFPSLNVANRAGYDTGTTAWLTQNKPNFAMK